MQWRNREKWDDKEHHEKASFFSSKWVLESLFFFVEKTCSSLSMESGKLFAWRACVFTRFRCLRAWVLTCLACLRAYVLTCLRVWRACVLPCLVCLHVCVFAMMKCFFFLPVCGLGVVACLIFFTFQYFFSILI